MPAVGSAEPLLERTLPPHGPCSTARGPWPRIFLSMALAMAGTAFFTLQRSARLSEEEPAIALSDDLRLPSLSRMPRPPSWTASSSRSRPLMAASGPRGLRLEGTGALEEPVATRRSAALSALVAAGALISAGGLGSAAHAAQLFAPPKSARPIGSFSPEQYLGTWYEVAALKTGFAAEGQEDCHCTQGMYLEDPKVPGDVVVSTLCVHGSPSGRVSGIQGKVQCVSKEVLENPTYRKKLETPLEKEELIFGKCTLKFPILPFLPKEPYDIIDTDYKSFALVQGAVDRTFVQIYSRTPTPGRGFIEAQKQRLIDLGYDPSKIKDTPQDCSAFNNNLAAAMSNAAMAKGMTTTAGMERVVDKLNAMQPAEAKLTKGIEIAGPRSVLASFKDFGELLKNMGIR